MRMAYSRATDRGTFEIGMDSKSHDMHSLMCELPVDVTLQIQEQLARAAQAIAALLNTSSGEGHRG